MANSLANRSAVADIFRTNSLFLDGLKHFSTTEHSVICRVLMNATLFISSPSNGAKGCSEFIQNDKRYENCFFPERLNLNAWYELPS